MSSYLTIYIVPTRKSDKEKKSHIPLVSYSRSSEIYQRFYEKLPPAFVGNGKEAQYRTLTKEDIDIILHDFDEDIHKTQARLTEYERYVKDDPDYIEDIIGMREYLEELHYWKAKTSFLADIFNDIEYYNEAIEELCYNTD